MESRKQVMVFAMGAMALLTAATSVIVAAHYWEMLSGIWLVAIVGLLLPDWCAWWATYWHTKAGEDHRVKVCAFLVAGMIALVMIGNAGAVMAVNWENQKLTAGQQVKQVGKDTSIKTRADQIAKLKAAGLSDRAIRAFMDTEAARDKGTVTIIEAVPSLVPDSVRKYMSFWVFVIPALFGLIGVFSLAGAIALPGGAEFSPSDFPSEIEVPK